MRSEKLLSRREIGICGSSKGLSEEAVEFCRVLGQSLASDPFITIVSGGSKQRADTTEGDLAADWHTVEAARIALGDDKLAHERIVTVVREDSLDATSFRIGSERRPRGKTSEARRISFVRGLDALIAIAGHRGTDQELALARELEKPVLPVPTFGGKSREFWDAYRSELIDELRIDERRAKRWESPAPKASANLRKLGDDMVDALIKSMPRRCFVIMPFHQDFDTLFEEIIDPAVKDAGDLPVRVDRAAVPGDVVVQINNGIKNCEYAIVVLDDLRANVLYELGIAHGCSKTTVLLNRRGRLGGEGSMPFDLLTQHRLEYEESDSNLRQRLHKLVTSLQISRH